MEKNTFERIEVDLPREKYYRIEREDGTVSYPNLTPIEETHITLENLTNICVEDMGKILEETQDQLIKKMEKHATSKSKTTKKRTAKVHLKAQ